jgi:uncharacterized membrane protein YqjE
MLDLLRGALATGVDLVHTRIRVLGVELEQEVLHACSLIVQAVATLLIAVLATVFIGVALIVVFWDNHRELVALLVAGFFVLLTAAAIGLLKHSVSARRQPFSATLEALERDAAVLRGHR